MHYIQWHLQATLKKAKTNLKEKKIQFQCKNAAESGAQTPNLSE